MVQSTFDAKNTEVDSMFTRLQMMCVCELLLFGVMWAELICFPTNRTHFLFIFISFRSNGFRITEQAAGESTKMQFVSRRPLLERNSMKRIFRGAFLAGHPSGYFISIKHIYYDAREFTNYFRILRNLSLPFLVLVQIGRRTVLNRIEFSGTSKSGHKNVFACGHGRIHIRV